VNSDMPCPSPPGIVLVTSFVMVLDAGHALEAKSGTSWLSSLRPTTHITIYSGSSGRSQTGSASMGDVKLCKHTHAPINEMVYILRATDLTSCALCHSERQLHAKSANAYNLGAPNFIADTSTCYDTTLWRRD